jgi:hypothetical protein
MGRSTARVPEGSFLGPILFLIYVNDLSKSVSDKSSPILIADDTSFIIANHDETEFKFNTNEILGHTVAQLVEALRYKLEGRGFDSRWCH